jgi:MFS family permease
MERNPIVSAWRAVISARNEIRAAGNGWILVYVALGWFFVFGTRFVFPTLLPDIRATFQISNTAAGAAITAIWVAYALVQFPSGLLSDRMGERLILVLSVLIAAVSVLLVFFSFTFLSFFLAAVLFGLGTGIYAPPRVIVLSNTFADRDSTAIALTFAAGSLGSAALPFIAGQLALSFDWRTVFAVVMIPFLFVALGLWRHLPEYSTDVKQAADQSAVHIVRRLSSALNDRAVLLSWLGITLSLFVLQGVTTFLPTYLSSVKSLSTGIASMIFSVFFLVGAFSQPISGSLGDRFGRRRVMVGLAILGVIPLSLFPVSQGLPVLLFLSIVLGIRLGLGPLNNAYLADALPEDIQGVGYGFVRTFHIALGSTGALVVGYLADNSLFDEAFYLLAILSLVNMVVYAALPTLSTS